MGSLYWRQFMLSAGMVLLTMVLLGVSFYALSYNYTVSEKRGEMRDRANLIAQLSVTYLVAGGETETTQEDALRALAGVASRMTDVDFLICNKAGDVLLTSDAGLVGMSLRVPEEIVDKTLSDGGYEGRSTVGVYEQKKFAVSVPMTDDTGKVLGLVLAVMDSSSLMEMWRSFIGLFFMLSAIILLVTPQFLLITVQINEFAEKGSYSIACAFATILILITYGSVLLMNLAMKFFGTSKKIKEA